jgi:hypothetical protein
LGRGKRAREGQENEKASPIGSRIGDRRKNGNRKGKHMRNLNLHYSKPSHWSFVRPHRHHCLVGKSGSPRTETNKELRRWAHWFNAEGMMMNNFGAPEEYGLNEDKVMSM